MPAEPLAEAATAGRAALRRHAPRPLTGASATPEQIGPLATALGQIYVVGTLMFSFGVLYDVLPIRSALILLAPALGVLCLAPSGRIRRARVSLPLLALLTWAALSALWTADAGRTSALLTYELPLLLGLVAVTGIMRSDDLVTAIRWAIRLSLAIVVVTLLTDVGARTSGDAEFVVAGWRGTFVAKNSLALFLVFALAATVHLERGTSRLATAAVIGVLVVGSESVTGLSGAALVLLLSVWLWVLRRQRGRTSSAFIVSSVALVGAIGIGAFANYTSILEAYGKDADLTGRTSIWGPVADAIGRQPEIGYGWGGLLNPEVPAPLTRDLWREIGFDAAHAHNGVLDLVGQLGFVGLGLYVVVLATTVAAATARLPSPLAAFALATVAAQMLMSVSENVFLGPWLVVMILLQAPFLGEAPGAGPDDTAS